MIPLVALVAGLTLPLPLPVHDVSLEDPLGLARGDVAVEATVAGIEVDTEALGVFLAAALPGPGFAHAILPPVDLAPAHDAHDDGPAIPVPLPEPAEAAVPAGLAVLGAAAYAVARWRFLGPWFLLPLYSRLARSEILENEVRNRLNAAINATPGLSLQELCALSGAGWGTTVYHLQRLEQAGLVTSKKQGHHRRFYTVGDIDRRDVDALGLLRNELPQRIAQFVVANPGTTQKDVCQALDISPSLAHKHLRRLEEQQLLTTRREWRSVHYTPEPKLAEMIGAGPPPGTLGEAASAGAAAA